MSKHTPGPWFHHGPSGSQHTAGGFVTSSIDRNGAPLICSIYGTDGQPYKANSSLIAAAPDLLEALELIVREQLVSADGEFGKVVFAALAKARGES